MNENTELPPLADPLFYVPAAGGGEAAAAAAADADSTMAVVARALDVFSSSRCVIVILNLNPFTIQFCHVFGIPCMLAAHVCCVTLCDLQWSLVPERGY